MSASENQLSPIAPKRKFLLSGFECSGRFNKLRAGKFAHCCAFFFSLLVPFFLFLGNEAGAAVKYVVVDLGPGYADCINNSGVVGGWGFIWDANQGRTETGMDFTYVSDGGLVAGTYTPTGTDRPCLWDPVHGITDIGLPGYRGEGIAISSNGIVVGWHGPSTNNYLQAFIWKPLEGMQSIHDALDLPPGESSIAADINASGKVLVNAFSYGSYIWDSVTNGVTAIPVPGGRARAFNDRGDVIFDDLNAIWTSAGGLTFFPDLPGYNWCQGRSLNNRGQVVGIGHDGANWNGFIWSDTTGIELLKDLIDPNSGWFIEYANDINDDGEIVGAAQRAGQSHAVLLVPLSLSIARQGHILQLTWHEPLVLQQSSDLSTWQDVIGAIAPFSVDMNKAPKGFWRLRAP